MKRLLLAFSLVLLALGAQEASAQERTVTGRVTNAETMNPLSGVQVVVKGSTVGTLTDANGNYTLKVPAGAQTLSFISLGYKTTDVPITGDVVNAALAPEAVAVEGVVVTAMGIEREKRALGVAVQELGGEELAEAREANIVNALSGKVAGVQITNAGPAGGSSRIVIRGATSIAGNNQPLFIVDGVPIDNRAADNSGYGGTGMNGREGSYDYGNAAQDINPNDIASITVLKGPNAAALYGSRAANGAVVITTKSGRGIDGVNITYSNNTTFENPLKLPDYQNLYGQGVLGKFAFKDGYGGGTFDGVDESWGPKCDGSFETPQFFSGGQPAPFLCYPNNVRDFFETGRTVNNSLSLATSSERSNVRLSVTDSRHDGMYPGQTLSKTTVALNGGSQLGERLRADASVNYIKSGGEQRPGTGYDESNPMQQFVWFGRSVDINRLRDYKNEDGTQYNWNYNYHANPYWIALENRNWDDRDRIIGQASLSYQLAQWLSATVRSGTDWYHDFRKRTYAFGFDQAFPKGAFGEDRYYQNEINTDVLLSANRDLTSDISLSANVGGNQRNNTFSYNRAFVEELGVPGIYNLSNAVVTPVVVNRIEEKRINSLYGSAQIGFRNYLFVDVTGRNDWSSTLPDGNNSYFYPSVSTSLVFTDAFGMQSDLLSFGKLRASWARVGNDADPYQLVSTYGAGLPWGSTPGFYVPNTIFNENLKPEITESFEIGADLRFLDNRLGLDVTYYDQTTRDQILRADISAASGYESMMLNAGEVSNRGVEVLLSATPVQVGDFRWEVTANFAKNENRVESLYGGLDSYILGGFGYWGVTAEARPGEPYGQLYGRGFRRDDQGRLIVDANGLPLPTSDLQLLGNYNPDWIGGLSNHLSFKGADLSFLVDTRQGGEIMSVTNMFGNYAGVTKESLRGRESGVCEPGILVEGVTTDGKPNTTRTCPINYFGRMYSIKESAIYDASFVKLREVKLGYDIPQGLLGRTPFSQMNVALVGRNLMLWDNIPNIDPETAFDTSNRQGFEFGQLPSARSIGINITVQP
jgi:TonB-linked SusC/RagA family outer membrane protein